MVSRRALSRPLGSQVLSSATNFLPIFLAGRLTGPAELGTLGFGLSVAAVGTMVTRSYVGEPYLAACRHEGAEDSRWWAHRKAAWIASTGTAATVIVSRSLGGSLGPITLLAGLTVPAVVQVELRRYLSFASDDGRLALRLDLLWFAVTLGGLAALEYWNHLSANSAMVLWGGGAGAALLWSRWSSRQDGDGSRGPVSRSPVQRRDLTSLGGWLLAAAAISALGGQAFQVIIDANWGTDALGGYRAALTLLAPLLVINTARVNVAMMRAGSRHSAPLWVPFPSLMAAGLVCVMILTVTQDLNLATPAGRFALGAIFGPAFEQYSSLVSWIALGVGAQTWAVVHQASLRSAARGVYILATQVVASSAGFVALLLFSRGGDVAGVGKAFFLQTAMISLLAWHGTKRHSGMSHGLHERGD